MPVHGVSGGWCWVQVKDERIKLTNEIFSGVKIIKLYAWEKSFEAKVKRVRDKEMALLKKYMLTNIGRYAPLTEPCLHTVVKPLSALPSLAMPAPSSSPPLAPW